MSCTTEEECRRQKIIRDMALIAAASEDASRAASGEMGMEEAQALIALDDSYMEEREVIRRRARSGRPPSNTNRGEPED